MAYALFYNMQDMSQIIAEATNAKLTGQERQYMDRLAAAGLANWQNAPLAPAPYDNPGAAPGEETRIFVVNGAGLTVAGLRDFLMNIATSRRGVSYYLEAIALDLQYSAVEPWPPVA